MAVLLCLLAGSTPAEAQFDLLPGREGFNLTSEQADGTPATQAGSHPFSVSATVRFADEGTTEGGPRDIHVVLPKGLFANLQAVGQCRSMDFVDQTCPANSAVGAAEVLIGGEGGQTSPVYNLVPSPGTPAMFGSVFSFIPVVMPAALTADGSLKVMSINTSQVTSVAGVRLELWGVPYDEAHDGQRGSCSSESGPAGCPIDEPHVPFLTLPVSCSEPPTGSVAVDSWAHSGGHLLNGEPDLADPRWKTASIEPEGITHLTGCDRLTFRPEVTVQAGSKAARSPVGMSAEITLGDDGLMNPNGVISSHIKQVAIQFPDGFTVNPSTANGLAACLHGQYEAELLDSAREKGCPNASKVGMVELMTPILGERVLHGAVYIAQPYENPLDVFLALYVVVRDAKSGVFIKTVAEVSLDKGTGQATMRIPEIPQLPIQQLKVLFWQGPRAGLSTPNVCGVYKAAAELYPWSKPEGPTTTTVAIPISETAAAGPCPPAGTPEPFHPGVVAGSVIRDAGAYTPFVLRITRSDSDQEFTSFAAKLPPGLLANLTAVRRCSDEAIQRAQMMDAAEASASPPCSEASAIGTAQIGVGVGEVLSYISGRVYLAGPYGGAPFSAVAIIPVRAGPFDMGTIVRRFRLQIDLEAGRIVLEPDDANTIPRIMDGVPTRVRDIRLYLDRDRFVVNPTSCEPFAVVTTIRGEQGNVIASEPFRASDCLARGLGPKISVALRHGLSRGAHPALTATVEPRPGDTNMKGARVVLPNSEQLDVAHLRAPCPRDRFEHEACPKSAQYGYARVLSPLLDDPLEGPILLVASKRKLPELVVRLEGNLVKAELVGVLGFRKGRLTLSFKSFPDFPVSQFTIGMVGGRRGILVNNRDLCRTSPSGLATIQGQNGQVSRRRLDTRVSCTRRQARVASATELFRLGS